MSRKWAFPGLGRESEMQVSCSFCVVRDCETIGRLVAHFRIRGSFYAIVPAGPSLCRAAVAQVAGVWRDGDRDAGFEYRDYGGCFQRAVRNADPAFAVRAAGADCRAGDAVAGGVYAAGFLPRIRRLAAIEPWIFGTGRV